MKHCHFLLLEGLALAGIMATFLVMAIGPRFIGYSSFVVYGGSMEPAIPKGSVAVGRQVAVNSLEVGDIIAYRAKNASAPTIHRIIEVQETEAGPQFVTQGDANSSPDPTLLKAQGNGAKIIYSVPYVGYVLHMPRALGPRFLLGVPAIGIGFLLIWTIWVPERKSAALADAR